MMLRYPAPNIEMMFNQLKGAKFFSKIDLTDGYWHIPIREKDREKTGFATRQGLWQWRCMPMGLKNSSFTFQRAMQSVLRKHLWKHCMVYVDDIIIYSETIEEHMEHVCSVLETLANARFYAKISKCKFLASEIDFLGHVITPEGIKADHKKVEAILNIPIPTNVTQLRRFLGMTGYYRKFIKNYAHHSFHLRDLLKKDALFEWNEERNIEFLYLKAELMSSNVMAYPDFGKPFVLTMDASKFGFGAILSQVTDGMDRVIHYASRSTNKYEQSYITTELEAAALVWAIDKFRVPYLLDHNFSLVTDHKALEAFKTISGKSAKLEHWSLKCKTWITPLYSNQEHRFHTLMLYHVILSNVFKRL